MTYFHDEVPKELKVDEVYTSREILTFLYENKDAIILADISHITDNSHIRYKVLRKIEKYVHRQSETNYRTYRIPNSETAIYELERV